MHTQSLRSADALRHSHESPMHGSFMLHRLLMTTTPIATCRRWVSCGLARASGFCAQVLMLLVLAACGGGGSDSPSGGSVGGVTTPVVTTLPASQTVAPGASVTFTVVATGDGLAYQWQRSTTGGVSWQDISGATTASHTVAAVDATMNGDQYRVVAQNSAGVVVSTGAILTVTGATGTAPTFAQQPSSVSTETSLVAAFVVAVTGTPTPTVQWEVSTDGGQTYAAISGATGASQQTTPAALADNGKLFRAVATNAAGTSRSNAATLTVRLGSIAGYPHSIATHSNGVTAFTARTGGAFPIGVSGVPQLANAQGEVGTLASAPMISPTGVVFDHGGNLLVAESGRHWILKVTPQGNVSVFAGSGALGCADGPAVSACFFAPWGLAIDGSGSVYVAEFGGARIRKISTSGQVTTVAGAAGSGYADGSAAVARFSNPQGVAVDSSGNLFVADTGNHAIRRIAPDGTVTTFAGLSGQSGLVDGTGAAARFSSPSDIAIDASGNLAVADSGNGAIRVVSPQGVVVTLAGGSPTPGYVDAAGAAARFGFVTGLTFDAVGDLLVADALNAAIRRVTPAGVVTTFVRR